MGRQVALLRGINVGGHRRVPMARLRELMGGLGYGDVRTYVQSGNVVFSGPDVSPQTATERLSGELTEAFGFEIAVVLRSGEELAEVVAANPLRVLATDPARYHVLFLEGELDPGRVADIDPARFEPEAFALAAREVFLWTPEGIGRSPLAQALSPKRLGLAATARNWRTVEKLLALAGEAL